MNNIKPSSFVNKFLWVLFVAWPLCIFNLHAANTLIVGNKTSINGTGGPTGDGYSTATFSAGANQIVIARASSLQPSNLKIQLGETDTAANGNTGLIYCTAGMGSHLTLKSHFIAAPYTYAGHQLFKTNVPGLYFTMRMYNLSSYKTDSTDNFYIGDVAEQSLNLQSQTCAAAGGGYDPIGGLLAYIDIEFYNDASFNPDTTGSIALLSDTSYHYSITNPSPGGTLFSKTIYQTFNLANVTLSSPTCTAAVLSGSSVTGGDTVGLGEYSSKEVIDGVDGIPFAIELQNCYRVSNVEVKMTTNTPAISAASLLGNTLTANAASGVGVEVKGESNSRYPEVILIPNNASSVYKAYVESADTTNGIIGTGSDSDGNGQPDGSPANQTLNFTATLKQDGNQQITGGDFKATAVFSITYP